jgi:O-antigen ligase
VGINVWSIFLWIINLETVEFILRGATKFMYQFLVLMIIFIGTYLFGERAIFTTFYGLVLANSLMAVINMGTYGPADSINSIITMLTGGEQEGFTRAMEIHDITFTYGFFIIYFLFFAQHTKERIIDILLALIFFIIGWKRIAMVALPIAIAAALIMGRMRSKHRINLMKFLAVMLVIISFLYVVATRTGGFEAFTNHFEIDTMGRNDVYKYIEKYYKISLGFIGYGFEYTTVILQQIMQANPEAHIGVVALHNNILTIYIELGFVGFWAWMLYTWIFQLNWMLNHWGEKVAMLFFLCELYIFITYATDNTLYYYYTSLTLRLMPMAYAFHERTEQDIKLWPWVRVQKGP